jgi:hypothetical protein
MLPKRAPILLLATAAGLLLLVHACISFGGTMRVAAVGFCAFALLVLSPIAVLAWLGSLSDLSAKSTERRRLLQKEKAEANLWLATLAELEQPAPAADSDDGGHRVASPPAPHLGAKARALGLAAAAASTLGLMGCEHYDYFYGDPVDIAIVQPGMGTTELVALLGAPEQIKSDGVRDVWQYCRDFLGRNARYYIAVMIEDEQVQAVRPYPVASRAGCEDFYRTGF